MHLELGPPGRWWNDADMAKRVGLSADQQKKMDEIFTANRLKLIDLFAAVQKEETIMEPLVAADPPDENKVLSQIDRVAQARAELEKANARMLLELRRQLTHDQFVKLQSERPPMHRGERGERRGGAPRPGMDGASKPGSDPLTTPGGELSPQ
jgi:Spy/CpxP family protein refolding chaperone